jgi:hypothetical protein
LLLSFRRPLINSSLINTYILILHKIFTQLCREFWLQTIPLRLRTKLYDKINISIFPLWTFHLYVVTFQKHLHMGYISLSWRDHLLLKSKIIGYSLKFVIVFQKTFDKFIFNKHLYSYITQIIDNRYYGRVVTIDCNEHIWIFEHSNFLWRQFGVGLCPYMGNGCVYGLILFPPSLFGFLEFIENHTPFYSYVCSNYSAILATLQITSYALGA